MEDELELIQDVRVLDVTVEDTEVLVDIYGGPDNACGSIRFRFEDADERMRQVALLRWWQGQGTLLAFMAEGSSVTLTNLDAFRG